MIACCLKTGVNGHGPSKFGSDPNFQPRVVLAYHEDMLKHQDSNYKDLHPEDPSRLTKIMSELQRHGLVARCDQLAVARATDKQLVACHSQEHLTKLASLSAQALGSKDAPGPGVVYADEMHDTYFNHWKQ